MNKTLAAGLVWGILGVWHAGQALAQGVRETARELVPQIQPALSAEGPPQGASVPGPVRTIGWEQLIPAGWDPFKDLKALNLDALKDNDPKADCLLYTSPSPRDRQKSRMPSSA